MICMEKLVKVDGKIRTDPNFPAGFMDVIEIPKSNDQFRIIFDTKGRFSLLPLSDEEKKFKLCKVLKKELTLKKVPYVTTHDGRTIRYPDPIITTGDTVKVDIETGKILDTIKFEVGTLAMIIKGRNAGRVGSVQKVEKHPGSFDIVTVKDESGHSFATRLEHVFVIGTGSEPLISLPKGKGIKLTILEEREMVMRKRKVE